jgi:UDP-glucuronate 4-epimerase
MQSNLSKKKKVLVTGAAGFIGFHLARSLFGSDYDIVGLDNINDYYEVDLKYGRLAETGIARDLIQYNTLVQSNNFKGYSFIRLNLEDKQSLLALFQKHSFDVVVNLAAQAGVRYSFTNPDAYIGSNIEGFLNILEACRQHPVKHLVYASSSSVYGLNREMPFSVHHNVDHPVSLYAASKKSNELMAHSYSHLFRIPVTGLRFFTVYGPWGRPDMSLFIFVKNILEGKPINVHNEGRMERDFTYVDDIVEGVRRVMEKAPTPNDNSDDLSDPAHSTAPYRIYNIGNSKPVNLMEFINAIEKTLDKRAEMNMIPMQPGEVEKTWADVQELSRDFNYSPSVSVEEGVKKFIAWYRAHYQK